MAKMMKPAVVREFGRPGEWIAGKVDGRIVLDLA
jgi:hypothetical protein